MSTPDHIEALRRRLAPGADGRRQMLSVPGCWDGLTALLVEQAQFEAAFLTGGGFSMGKLGRPDLGLTTLPELVDATMAIRDRISIPLLVDCDTGFGEAANVQRTIRLVERAGASALQIEDQSFPKRCGHMAGKSVVSVADAVGRIRATLDARDRALVIARTDALGLEGVERAIDRAEAYLDEGADLIFIEGPSTWADLNSIGARFGSRVPLVHNLVEGGVTPTQEGSELENSGFAVALHPLILMHGLIRAAPGWLAELRQTRSTNGLGDALANLGELNQLSGLHDFQRSLDRFNL